MRRSPTRRVGRFFLIATSVVFILHTYIGIRLIPDLRFATWIDVAVGGWLVASAIAIPAAMRANALVKRQHLADLLAWMGLSAMGLFSSLFVLTLLRDLVLLPGYWLLPPGIFVDLLTQTARAVLALSLLATVIGFINARRTPAVVRVKIPIENLPRALENFTVVQISDVHIGPTIKGHYLQKIVDRVNGLQPHVIAITGDLVDGSVERLKDQVAPLKNLRSDYGSYFVTGNHEYYSGADAWIDFVRSLSVNVLLNQHVVIQHNHQALILAGVTDYNAPPMHRSDVHAALAGAEHSAAPKILLAHQPRTASAASAAGFDLQLSGHTHGGQFWPWNFFVTLQQPFTVGLHRLGKMWIYINRGTGYWGPPKRLGRRSEITCIQLMKA